MPYQTPTILKISVLALAVSFTFVVNTAFAWTAPTATPPNGNVSAPINTSTSDQIKTGGLLSVFNLWVDQTLSVIGGIATGGANIEHTAYGTGNRYSYIDFHGDDTYTDYGLRLLRGNSGPNSDSWLQNHGTGTLNIDAQDAGGSISLRQNSADRLFVNSAGNVGIGTTAPGAKLDVSQTTAGAIGSLISMPTAVENTAPGIRVHGYSPAIELLDKDNVQNWYMGIDDNDANKLLFGRGYGPGQGVAPSIVIDTTGNVGIGTATPAKILDVNGDALVNGITVGRGGGNVSLNTAVGGGALGANTTGYSNAALGATALLNNTTGYYNTASGVSALYNNTTGSYNTANGFLSLQSNNSGTFNTATGYASLYLNISSGSYNTANGANALFSNTTGSYNTASGVFALISNTTGSYNTAIGTSALQINTVGNQNSANGYFSLRNNTTGGANAAFGPYALQFNTTGNYNTALGNGAGPSSGALTNTTAIGSGATVSASNEIQLGNTAVSAVRSTGTFYGADFCAQGGCLNALWSDKRLKENITDYAPGLDFITKLRPVTYSLKKDTEHKTRSGFIAQEVEAIGIPFYGINKPKTEDEFYSLNYNEFVVPLVNSVKELKAENDKLKAYNEALLKRVEAIEAKLK